MSRMSEILEANRGKLLGLAYRMLGSHADAEDALQDAYLRVAGVDRPDIVDPAAYLFTTVTRVCLDHLKSARRRREQYVGPWLPEPDPGEVEDVTPSEKMEDISFALMMVLEQLSPPERAAFLLHDVFDRSYGEVAEILERSEVSCRQLASRARRSVRTSAPPRKRDPQAHRELLKGFATAVASGDMASLEQMLARDVIAYNDGGGVRIAALNPIYGADKVARFYLGVMQKVRAAGAEVSVEPATINGDPALLLFLDGELDETLGIDCADGKITAIYAVRNPEKLGAVERWREARAAG